MEDNRTRNIFVFIVFLMVVILTVMGILYVINKQDKEDKGLKLEQVYVSENKLVNKDKYYYGIRDNNIISIIDNKGNELYLNDYGIKYQYIDKLVDDDYLLYSYDNNIFDSYIFNGKEVIQYLKLDNVSQFNRIIYRNNEDYINGFLITINDSKYYYGMNNKVINLDDKEIVFDNNNYIYNNDSLIVKKDNKYGVIDLDGKQIIDYKYDDIVNSNMNTYIVKLKNKWGIVDKNNNIIKDISNKYIISSNIGYMLFNKNLYLYDKDFNKIYNDKIKYSIKDIDVRNNNINLYKKDYKYLLILDNIGYIINKEKMNKVNIDSYYYNDLVGIYSNNILSIYDEFLNKVVDINLVLDSIKNIIKIKDDRYYLEYIFNDQEYKVIIDKDGNIENSDDEVLYSNSSYIVYKRNNRIKLISYDGEILESIEGNDIIVNRYNIVVDNSIYIVK